ncbi:unnamed protein product [Choristocarpus tenellus]
MIRRVVPHASMGGHYQNTMVAERDLVPECVILLHRHGDRSPLRGHAPDEELPTVGQGGQFDHTKDLDAAWWRERMVPLHELQRLGQLYPIDLPNMESQRDAHSAPFGCLTSLGLNHLRHIGKDLRLRYCEHGLGKTRIEAFSTNYHRTQLSAQGLLDGMLAGRGGVPVVVMPLEDNFLNNFESKGAEMTRLMRGVEARASFKEIEEAVGGPLKSALHQLAPMVFPIESDGRFRWMMAADYFWCAQSHGLDVPAQLGALSSATIEHLAWRFSQFYGDRELLRAMSGSLLSNILERASRVGSGAKSPAMGVEDIVCFSCHDVTIMSLLYALQSDLVKAKGYWSPYGSTIMLEVLGSKPQICVGKDTTDLGLGQSKEVSTIDSDEQRTSRRGDKSILRVEIDGMPLQSPLCDENGIMTLGHFHSSVGNLLSN